MTHTKDLGQRLLDLKQSLEQADRERTELQGELRSLLNQLKGHGATSLEEAQSQIQHQESVLRELEATIRESIQSIEELME